VAAVALGTHPSASDQEPSDVAAGWSGEVEMLVGVPRKIKDNEFRVGLTLSAVRELSEHGHKVIAG
jgi:hypothetical protein